MADIFLLFLAAYHYSAISTVISGFRLAEDRSAVSRGLQHLSEMQQERETHTETLLDSEITHHFLLEA